MEQEKARCIKGKQIEAETLKKIMPIKNQKYNVSCETIGGKMTEDSSLTTLNQLKIDAKERLVIRCE